MSKTNKELAIDVAIAVINTNSKMTYGINNSSISRGLDIKSICNVINATYQTLENLDTETK